MIWPALAAVSLLAWTQALTWMPYGLPGLRVILAVLWLGTIDTIVLVALQYHASEPVMVAIVAPQIPLAYLAARFAVARARRGDVPDWRARFARPVPTAAVAAGTAGRFCVARRRTGVVRVAAAWPVAAGAGGDPAAVRARLAVARQGRAGIRLRNTVSRADHAAVHGRLHRVDGEQAASTWQPSYGLPPFSATRPLTSAELIARQAEDGDVEHAGRVGAGVRHHPARARLVGHLARGDGTRAAPA